jgi:hypothetical protein
MIVIIPDTTPLIHLAAGELLHILPALGRVVVPDVIAMEATRLQSKPFAPEVAAWLKEGHAEIADTDWGPIYKLAAEQGMKTPCNAGEAAILTWLQEHLTEESHEAIVVYEDKRVPAVIEGAGTLDDVIVLTTRSFLVLAEDRGIIPSAEAAWSRVIARAPTASPAFTRTMKPAP